MLLSFWLSTGWFRPTHSLERLSLAPYRRRSYCSTRDPQATPSAHSDAQLPAHALSQSSLHLSSGATRLRSQQLHPNSRDRMNSELRNSYCAERAAVSPPRSGEATEEVARSPLSHHPAAKELHPNAFLKCSGCMTVHCTSPLFSEGHADPAVPQIAPPPAASSTGRRTAPSAKASVGTKELPRA